MFLFDGFVHRRPSLKVFHDCAFHVTAKNHTLQIFGVGSRSQLQSQLVCINNDNINRERKYLRGILYLINLLIFFSTVMSVSSTIAAVTNQWQEHSYRSFRLMKGNTNSVSLI